MEIYVRVDEDGFGECGWLYHDGDQSYLTNGLNSFYDVDGASAVLPAKSVKEAKRWMKEAKSLMEWDGATGKVTASAWRFVRGRLTKTAFTKDDKIKK